jgi:hypothetical protein
MGAADAAPGRSRRQLLADLPALLCDLLRTWGPQTVPQLYERVWWALAPEERERAPTLPTVRRHLEALVAVGDVAHAGLVPGARLNRPSQCYAAVQPDTLGRD